MSDTTEGMTYIGLEDVESESGKYSPTDGNSRQSDSSTVGVFSKGQVLYGKLRPYLKKSIIADFDGVCSTEFLVLQPERVLPELLHRWFLTSDVTQQIEATCEGAKMPRADWESIGNISMPLPPKQEQLKIRESIQFETNRIDTLITKKTRFIELIKEKILAIAMNEQMHGKDKFVRLGRLVQVISRPVKIVKEKEYIALGLYNRGRGLFHKPATLGKDIGDSNFFYVEEDDLIISGQFAWEGAVTMASKSEEGCVVSHRYPILRGDTINTEYLYALLMTHFGDFLLNESSRGAAGRNRPLNINLLLNEKIRLPSTEAQMQIKKLTNLKRVIDNKIYKSIKLLKERRSAFITAAVTGQIDLREEVQ